MQITNAENKKNATEHHFSQKIQGADSANSIRIEDISKLFIESCNIIVSDNTSIVTPSYNHRNLLPDIERLVRYIAQSNDIVFCIKDDACKGRVLHKDQNIINWLKNCSKIKSIENILSSFPDHKFNPYITQFLINYAKIIERYENKIDLGVISGNLYSIRELSCNKNYDNLLYRINIINEFINNIKSDLTDKQFKKSVANHSRILRQNCGSSDEYIDELLKKNPKLIAVHLDIFNEFDINNYPTSDIRNRLLQVKNDFERFLNNKRSNKLFNHRVGYIWKLDYRPVKGICYNVVLFFDDSILKEYPNIDKDIRGYWLKAINKKTAKNHNMFIPQNINATVYKNDLKRNVSKLIYLNYYLKIDLGVRTFGKGI